MENKENILDELTNFEKRRPNDIPQILEDYLIRIAKTGDTMFPWTKLKPLFMYKMERVMAEFYESCPIDDIMHCPNVERFKYDLMKDKLLEAIDNFNSAPFTIQRLCELVTSSRKHYKHTDKFMRGLEKNVLVVSTVEPGCSHIYACDCARKRADHQTAMMNGVADGLNGVDRHSDEMEDRSDKMITSMTSLSDSVAVESAKEDEDGRLNEAEKKVDVEMHDGEVESDGNDKEVKEEVLEQNLPPDKLDDGEAELKSDDMAVSSSIKEPEVEESSRKRCLEDDDDLSDKAESADSSCKRGKSGDDVTQSTSDDAESATVTELVATSSAELPGGLGDDHTSCDSEGFEATAMAKADSPSDVDVPIVPEDIEDTQQVATTTSSTPQDPVASLTSISTTTPSYSDAITDFDDNNLATTSGDDCCPAIADDDCGPAVADDDCGPIGINDDCGPVGVDDDDDDIATTVTTTETVPVRDEDDNAMDVPASDSLLITTGSVTTTMVNSTDVGMASTSDLGDEDQVVDGGSHDEPMEED